MKIITLSITIVMWALAMIHCNAQEEVSNTKIELLNASKEQIINQEKDALKRAVEAINLQLDSGKIT